MTSSKKPDFNSVVEGMRAWLDPNGPHQQRILHDLAFGNPIAVKFTLNDPAPDGDIEILFVAQAKLNEFLDRHMTSKDKLELLSFAEGMRIAQLPNCSGGPYIYKQGLKLMDINPALRDGPATDYTLQ